jgi:hypothetical protein
MTPVAGHREEAQPESEAQQHEESQVSFVREYSGLGAPWAVELSSVDHVHRYFYLRESGPARSSWQRGRSVRIDIGESARFTKMVKVTGRVGARTDRRMRRRNFAQRKLSQTEANGSKRNCVSSVRASRMKCERSMKKAAPQVAPLVHESRVSSHVA